MSVLIKGMEMPKSCGECRFMVDRWCYASEDAYFVIDKRHPDCPLVEIPTPHGRLIDYDRLIETLNAEIKDKYDADINYFLRHAPTVIEEEL